MKMSLSQDKDFPGITLRRIWKYEILPLLREYAYTSTPAEVEEKYGLDTIVTYGD